MRSTSCSGPSWLPYTNLCTISSSTSSRYVLRSHSATANMFCSTNPAQACEDAYRFAHLHGQSFYRSAERVYPRTSSMDRNYIKEPCVSGGSCSTGSQTDCRPRYGGMQHSRDRWSPPSARFFSRRPLLTRGCGGLSFSCSYS